ARRAIADGGPSGMLLAGAALAQTIGAAALILMMAVVPEPGGHARQAVIFVTLGYAALHCGVGALLAGHGVWRMGRGYVSARRSTELSLAWLWNGYAAGTVVLALGLTLLLGMMGEAP